MKKILFILTLSVTLCSCHKDHDEDPVPVPDPQHTVLVYMSGENNLADCLTDDLKELTEGSLLLSKDDHLIAYVDTVGKDIKPYIIEITQGQRKKVYEFDTDFSSADPKRFREVIDWTVRNYPANDYGLVLWGHASGWYVVNDTIASTRAYGVDKGYDISGKETWMNITQLSRALDGLPKMRFIMGDCCCLMCVECAYELRNHADYLIGSPAEIPDAGAPYQLLTPTLFTQSETFYRDIIDCYYDYYKNIPLSAIDLSQMETLATATRSAVALFAPTYPEEVDLSGLTFYDGYESYKMMYDMKQLMEKHAAPNVYADWEKAFAQAVPYSRMAMRWTTIFQTLVKAFPTFEPDRGQYGCVSMFVPQNVYKSSSHEYNKRWVNFAWGQYVNWSEYGW